MDWDKLRIFHAVAEAGSFTHASETLNLSQSAISRQISGLEQNLKVPLFHRHARGLILTEQGEDLYKTSHEVFHKVAMTEARLTESKEQPEGPLTITTTVGFGSVWLTPRIKEFMDQYPEIDVTILLVYDDLDLAMRAKRHGTGAVLPGPIISGARRFGTSPIKRVLSDAWLTAAWLLRVIKE